MTRMTGPDCVVMCNLIKIIHTCVQFNKYTYIHVCVYRCVCVVIPFILDVKFVDVPAGVTQEEGHTGFLHLLSAVHIFIFLARRIQPFLSLVDRQVEFCVLTN